MKDADSKSLDVLGVRPMAKAVDRATEATLAGAGAFLRRICLPAAEEFGLLLKDRVGHWRAKNAAKIVAEAEVLTSGSQGKIEAHPRLVWEVIDKGSWTDDELVQKMWAGLLASSCASGAGDDSNILFTSILGQLTSMQVRILTYASEASSKYASKAGLPLAEDIRMTFEELAKLTGVQDIHRLDRELDHLRSMELIGGKFSGGGFSADSAIADIGVTPLALHLYVRAHGFVGSPVEYWNLKQKEQRMPNQSVQPTPGSGTARADARSAPDPSVADL